MNIGIILYSETGNTYSVSQKLKEKLIKGGHSVNLERLKVIGKVNPGKKNIQFDSLPDIEKSLQDKKVAFLVTQFFPFPWLGGNRTIGQMKKICESKGAIVFGTAVINWSKSSRKKQITDMVEKLSKLF